MEYTTTFVWIFLFLFALESTSGAPAEADTWCFVKEGCNQNSPSSDWNQGTCKDGKMQSPIDINIGFEDVAGESEIDMSHSVRNYNFNHFQMRNEGKHVELSGFKTVSGGKPSFAWPDREDTVYSLQQIHMHWGPTNDNGSEHSIAGQKYAMEMHLMHYKSSSSVGAGFQDIAEAKKSGVPDALATIAILFQVSVTGSASESLKPMISNLKRVVHRGDKVSVDNGILKLGEILKVQSKALTYNGSTTTPPCAEVVLWFVIPDPVNIRGEDVQIFRDTVHGVDNKILNTNRRRTQCGKEREIEIVKLMQ